MALKQHLKIHKCCAKNKMQKYVAQAGFFMLKKILVNTYVA